MCSVEDGLASIYALSSAQAPLRQQGSPLTDEEPDAAKSSSMPCHRAYMRLLLEPKSFTPKSAFVGGLFVFVFCGVRD